LRAAAPIVAGIRDAALRPEYARLLAGWIGTDERSVVREIQRAASTPTLREAPVTAGPGGRGAPEAGPRPASGALPQVPMPDPRGPVARDERLALVAVLQYPQHVPASFDGLGEDAFSVPAWRAVHTAIRAAGGVTAGRELSGAQWVAAVLEQASETVAGLVTQLSVATLPEDREAAVPAFVEGLVRRVVDLGLMRRVADARSRLQRIDPADTEAYQTAFAELLAIEAERRTLRESA